MTMQNVSHPDDERLAAYAGGDADAVSDRALAEHVSSCDRCAPVVDELTLLRVALAGLPDLAPSRPLRLIPPVAASAPRAAGPLGWLRRLAAPAMAAGAGLVLVGAVGMSGVVDSFSPAGADRQALEASASDAAAPGESVILVPGGQAAESPKSFSPTNYLDGRSQTPREYGNPDSMSATASPRPSEPASLRGQDDQAALNSTPTDEQPWLTLLIAGAAIFGVSTMLRFSLAPQAG